MPTTTVKTIGTGGDYSTVQAWEDACTADLVAADEIWEGQLKNETFSSTGTVINISGMTTDATRFVRLRCETGASFSDNASVQTNALRYNASNGAALTGSSNYNSFPTIRVGNTIHCRLSGLQVQNTGGGGWAFHFESTSVVVDRCIFEAASSNSLGIGQTASNVSNSLFVQRRGTSPSAILNLTFGASLYNCTVVSTAAQSAVAFVVSYADPTIRNCNVFNIAAIKSGTPTPTYTTCLTDLGSPPTGFTQTAYATGSGIQFESITDGSHDFRIKTGSSAKDAGTTDSTNAAVDIAGTSRPSGSAYDVGCWEFFSAPAVMPIFYAPFRPLKVM